MFPCIDNLRDASFRGVSFFVDSDDENYGRRIVSHEFPNRDNPVHEDLGEKYITYKVKAYVHGENAISHKNEVIEACRAYGPAILILPAIEPTLARCMSVTAARTKDTQGYFTINMEFRAELNTFASMPFVEGEYEGIVTDLIGHMATGLADIAPLMFSVRDTLQFAVDDTTTRVQDFALTAIEFLETLTAQSGEPLAHEASNLFGGVDTYCNDPAGLVAIVNTICSRIADAGPQAATAKCLKQFAEHEGLPLNKAPLVYEPVQNALGEYIPVAVPPILSVSEKRLQDNAAFFDGCVRKFGAAYHALTITRSSFDTRAGAITVRADIVEWFNREINDAQDSEILYNVLTQMRDTVVTFISKAIINLVPVIEISVPSSMPSLYWANRLYADANRADEIVTRNQIVDPAFTPTVFEALAR